MLEAATPRSEGLAAEVGDAIESGQRVLVVGPEGNGSGLRDALERAGANVDAVAFYRNVPAPGLVALAAEVGSGRYDIVVFTSPSTLHRLLGADPQETTGVRAALRDCRRVAIGPVTAQALEHEDLAADAVALTPDDDGIVAAVGRLARL